MTSIQDILPFQQYQIGKNIFYTFRILNNIRKRLFKQFFRYSIFLKSNFLCAQKISKIIIRSVQILSIFDLFNTSFMRTQICIQ